MTMEPIFDTLLRWLAENHELRGVKVLITADDPVWITDEQGNEVRRAPTYGWTIEASEYGPAEGPDGSGAYYHATHSWTGVAGSQDEAAAFVVDQLRAAGYEL